MANNYNGELRFPRSFSKDFAMGAGQLSAFVLILFGIGSATNGDVLVPRKHIVDLNYFVSDVCYCLVVHVNTKKFQWKKFDILNIFAKFIDYGYALKPPNLTK